MIKTPHKDKLLAAINNPKAINDKFLLEDAYDAYKHWISQMSSLKSQGDKRVVEMTKLLNDYKDYLEVDLIAAKGSSFLKRQKGQLKLDNSVLEEYLTYLIHPGILNNLIKV